MSSEGYISSYSSLEESPSEKAVSSRRYPQKKALTNKKKRFFYKPLNLEIDGSFDGRYHLSDDLNKPYMESETSTDEE